MTTIPSEQHTDTVLTTVLSFLNALNREDFDSASNYVNDDLQFIGVLGSRDGATAYLSDMRQLKIKYVIKKSFSDGQDVCVLCDFQMTGRSVFGSGWYQLMNGRISSIRVVFDPRPLLEKPGK